MTAEAGQANIGGEQLPKGVTKAKDWPGIGRGYHVDVGQDGPTTIYVPEGEDLIPHLQKTYKDFGIDPSAALKRIGERGSATIGSSRKEPVPNQMGFYSRLQNFTDNLPDNGNHNPLGLANQLQKGVTSKMELDETGVLPWLREQKGRVTTQQVRDYVDQHQIKVEERVLGGGPQEAEYKVYRPRFNNDGEQIGEDLTLVTGLATEARRRASLISGRVEKTNVDVTPPKYNRPETLTPFEHGAEPGSYRELVMTMPNRAKELNRLQVQAYNENRHEDYAKLEKEIERAYSGEFTSSHYSDIPNPLVHTRFDSRIAPDGKKVLFIHEIQSDWHQRGREEGYQGNYGPKISDAEYKRGGELQARERNGEQLSESERAELIGINTLNAASLPLGKVPNAPFKNTPEWTGLAAKRLLRYAAENGYDRIAWTPGEAQAERYDLSKHISELHYSGTNLKAYDHNGKTVIEQTGITPEQLPDYVGKEAAQRLLDQPKQGTLRSLTGQDLKVGGEGMKGFYGSPEKNELGIVGGVMNDLGKKWGSKVGTSEIPSGDKSQTTTRGEWRSNTKHKVHSLDLPSSMKEEVKTKGQPIAGLLPTLLGRKEARA